MTTEQENSRISMIPKQNTHKTNALSRYHVLKGGPRKKERNVRDMSMMNSVKRAGFRAMYGYLDKDPDANIPKLMDWVDRFAGNGPNSFPDQRAAFRKVIESPDNNWYRLIRSMWTDIDGEVRKTFFENFMLNGNLIGWAVQEEARERYGCNIPWAILLDPTSACNLH